MVDIGKRLDYRSDRSHPGQVGESPIWASVSPVLRRDIAGALGLHRAAVAQYMRPEIIGLVLGSALTALFAGEYRARGVRPHCCAFSWVFL